MSQTRRGFVQKIWTVLALAGIRPGKAQAVLFGGRGGREEWVQIGRLEDFVGAENGVAVKQAIRLKNNRAIRNPRWIAYRRGDEVFVLSVRCTHLGCEVGAQSDGTWLCPCHRALFAGNGEVLRGPANKPLPWFAVRILEDGAVHVNIEEEIPPPDFL